MNSRRRTCAVELFVFLSIALSEFRADASVIAVGPGAFPAGSTLITFTGLADGTEVNGLSVGGVLFSYSLGNGMVIIDGGPGITNNVAPPNIVSIGNPGGVLTLTLPGFFDTFGDGYAILNTVAVLNATTINLFSGATNVGSLSYNGVPDPTFTGGFAGIQSTIPFNRVAITFNAAAAPAFALDNIRIASVSAIPEPSTVLLILSGVAGLLWVQRRKIL
ncbi:MAG: PEP-CTERM sorting domain-containing protein [Bryobacteraceae bacterium]